jgi:DNA-binding transcriptional ArsR family regulator
MDTETLLQFFKALANENRLKILGILATRECGVGELATLLDLKAPTVSHHLSRLKELRLLDMRRDGNDHFYRLNATGLQAMNKQVLTSFSPEKVAALGNDVEYETWERKVLSNFVEGNRITGIPARHKRRLVVLKWLANQFEENVKYPEKDLNEIIERHHPDYVTLRRQLIADGLMEREAGVYWRTDWQMPDWRTIPTTEPR